MSAKAQERETKAFYPLIVTNKRTGATVTAYKVALTMTADARPTEWADPVEVDGAYGVIVGPLAVGTIATVWVRLTTAAEDLIVKCKDTIKAV